MKKSCSYFFSYIFLRHKIMLGDDLWHFQSDWRPLNIQNHDLKILFFEIFRNFQNVCFVLKKMYNQNFKPRFCMFKGLQSLWKCHKSSPSMILCLRKNVEKKSEQLFFHYFFHRGLSFFSRCPNTTPPPYETHTINVLQWNITQLCFVKSYSVTTTF